jgi:translation initiation factor 3 subunit F
MSTTNFLRMSGGAASGNYEYKLHPVVIFSILDHYKRRSVNQSRVVGTLMGERRGDVIYVKNSFPVPHEEDEGQVAVDMDYHRTMLNLYQQVYTSSTAATSTATQQHGKQYVVGWYSTGDTISYLSALIHQVYQQEVETSSNHTITSAVHLMVDVTLQRAQMPIRAYKAKELSYNKQQLQSAGSASASGSSSTALATTGSSQSIASRFESCGIELHSYESERIGIDALINGVPESDPNRGDSLDAPAQMLGDLDNYEHALIRLLDALDTCTTYVQRVEAGEIQGNTEYGEAIYAALSTIPHIDASTLHSIFQTHLQDLLMLIYLANVTHTEVNIADKVAQLIQ